MLRGTAAIPGAAAAVERLRALTTVAIATNNASRSPDEVAQVLREAGIDTDPAEVATSSQAAAGLLDAGARCLVVGTLALCEALVEGGCTVVEDPDDAQAVVVGFDPGIDYATLRRATRALRAGARFVATNLDATFPGPDGLWPGNGAIVAALATASSREPEVAGKPHAPLFRTAQAHFGEGPVLMVGDRLETDIAGALELGWDAALVLTGIVGGWPVEGSDVRPTYVADSLAALVEGRLRRL